MRRLLLAVLVLAPLAAAPINLSQLLTGVEKRYNRANSLSIQFQETYAAPGRSRQAESGVLHLRKPGKMRWDYTAPKGKQFVSDGKHFYLYSPGNDRAQKRPMKQSEDLHAPLAFLLGRLNFQQDFEKFESRAEGDNTWINAFPNKKDLPYTHVEFLVNRDYQILFVRVHGQDNSTLEFRFNGEQINPTLDAKLFVFTPPTGVQLVEATE
ncbi:MAG: outer membrane lipoprotein chaperone LolA [Bryobacteraceae bacterium]